MSSQSINLYNQLAKHKLFNKTINFNLKRIKTALSKLGHPERRLSNVIQIIGSDGKFSVLRALRFFIEGNDQTVSTHVSPSLTDIRERFWMGKDYLSHSKIRNTIKIIEKLKIPLTIYEVLTLVFIINASRRNNDYCIQEAGALWRLDSNNVIDFPLKQIVVNINKQHLNFVKKKTLDEIINQKVGFLSQFTDIYIGKQKPYVLKKIKKILKKNISHIKYSYSWRLIKEKNNFFYKDKKIKIKLNTKYIHSKGLLENLCLAINIALDLKINKKTIIKALPKIRYAGRIDYLDKGKLSKKLFSEEKILIDGCHSEISGQNLANYLKSLKIPIYGIWGMTKNKDPDLFIKQFKKIFKKIITIPIVNEPAAVSNKLLLKIAKKNNYNADTAKTFEEALRKITSKERKIICVFGSLYLCGNILNKN
tara:strand:+ start:11975 stop:13240 length:1266 start_codon:yes stop_codon:yes gene_type:complete